MGLDEAGRKALSRFIASGGDVAQVLGQPPASLRGAMQRAKLGGGS